MKFKNYKDFAIQLRTDLLLEKFSPYNREQLFELVKLSNEKKISIDLLYEEIIEKNLPFDLFLKEDKLKRKQIENESKTQVFKKLKK